LIQQSIGAARRKQFDTQFGEFTGEIDNTGFIRNTDKGSFKGYLEVK
jgi:hypothetical protein